MRLRDEHLPLEAEIVGWSPFIPGNEDDSSLPVAALEYTLRNTSASPLRLVYSFHAKNFLPPISADRAASSTGRIEPIAKGFALLHGPDAPASWMDGAVRIIADAPRAFVNCRWFRGSWFDPLTMLWRTVARGETPAAGPYDSGEPSPGASLYVPLELAPGQSQSIRLRLCWHFPKTELRNGWGRDDATAPPDEYEPWYTSRFDSAAAVDAYWSNHYERLRIASAAFADCFHDTTLPPEIVEAAEANLAILKSPTVLRQRDGRLWLWEGSQDGAGSCEGSCTHVWNYAQGICHLFPQLERSLRETEFWMNQDERGHQSFRACLPIRPNTNGWHAAADGQLGGVMKIFREWRISGDTQWLRNIWPRVRQSLDFSIAAWDPDHRGLLNEPHHNTYDIEFWGPDGMCGSFYAGALKAACVMADALGEPVPLYELLLAKAKHALETELFDGEYFFQHVRWKDLHHPPPGPGAQTWNVNYSPEALALLEKEGPKYQYGIGCLSDGVLGEWLAATCGVGPVLDQQKVRSHLLAVFRHNWRQDLSTHANPQRPGYAIGNEAGLLLCSWPKGGEPSLPFIYSNEVWTGIEYQVASHLMLLGQVDEALEIVRGVRSRYDGRIRNPFDEIECGHWYGRAMASYALLQGMTGQRYDAVEKVLRLNPQITGDWRAFLCTEHGYGTVGMTNGKPFVEVRQGHIDVREIRLDV